MLKRTIAGLLMVTSLGAHAALQTVAAWDTLFAANGLAGVKFSVASSGNAYIGLGAHRYINGVSMPNDGVNTFFGQPGLYPNPPLPPGNQRANWSFDWIYSTEGCTGCKVYIQFDQDWQTGNVNYTPEIWLNGGSPLGTPPTGFGAPAAFAADSWNMMMGFLAPLGFDPNAPSSTAFQLTLRDSSGQQLAQTSITVNVPEPGSLALAGAALALVGAAAARRRRS